MDAEFRSDMTVDLIAGMTSDLSVARAAWVSTMGDHSQDHDNQKIDGLINYLMKNRHGTPFEHNSFVFFVKAPIFVFREFQRHRIGFSYNEESGRYRELRPIFYIPSEDRKLIQVGKAGHYSYEHGTERQHVKQVENMKQAYLYSYAAYKSSLELGIAREVARAVLPVGIYSSMYVTCNARSLMAFLSLRTGHPESKFPSYPQREIEMVAEKMELVLEQLMPITYAAFVKNGRVSP